MLYRANLVTNLHSTEAVCCSSPLAGPAALMFCTGRRKVSEPEVLTLFTVAPVIAPININTFVAAWVPMGADGGPG